MLEWKIVTISLVLASAGLTQTSRIRRDENSSGGLQVADGGRWSQDSEEGHAIANRVPLVPRATGRIPMMHHGTSYAAGQDKRKTDQEKDSSEEDQSPKLTKPSAAASVVPRKESSEEDESRKHIKPVPSPATMRRTRPFQLRPTQPGRGKIYPIPVRVNTPKFIPRWYMQHRTVPFRPRIIKPSVDMPKESISLPQTPSVPINPKIPTPVASGKDSSEEDESTEIAEGGSVPVAARRFRPSRPRTVLLAPRRFKPPPILVSKPKPAFATSIKLQPAPITPRIVRPVTTRPTKVVRPKVISKFPPIVAVVTARPKPHPLQLPVPRKSHPPTSAVPRKSHPPTSVVNIPKAESTDDSSSEENDESTEAATPSPIQPTRSSKTTSNRQKSWRQRAWDIYRQYSRQRLSPSWRQPATREQRRWPTAGGSSSRSGQDSSQEVPYSPKRSRTGSSDSSESSDDDDDDDDDERYYRPPPRPYCPRIADVVFMLDGSDSLTEHNFQFGKSIVDRSIAQLHLNEEDGIVAGVLVFSDSIQEIRLRPFKDNVYLRTLVMRTYQEMGGTGTDYALYNMRRLFWAEARPGVPKIGVLLTDGRSRNPSTAIEQARMAKMEGIYLITIAVGVVTNPSELEAIASSSELVIKHPTASVVVQHILKFAIQRCPGPTPKPIPTSRPGIPPPISPTYPRPSITPFPPQPPLPPRPGVTPYPRPPQTWTPRPFSPWTTPYPLPFTTPKRKGPCDDCKFLNGVGYNPHESECSFYYQCFNNNGVLVPYQRECPYGLFWDQRDLTCKPAAAVDCATDPCKKSHQSHSYVNLCRAYWTCRWGRTISADCCPYSHRHTMDRGCVYDPTCPNACPPVSPSQPAICNRRPYPQDRTQYYEDIGQGREIVRRCAPGTAFVAAPACRCDKRVAIIRRPWECKPDLYLPFNNDFNDYSGQNVQTFSDNVTIDRSPGTIGGGAARFNGRSRVLVWKYANDELGSNFVIRFRYKGLPVEVPVNQSLAEGLVTNSDCMEPCSVSIAYFRQGNRTTGKIRTVDSGVVQGILPHRDDWNDVEYKYDGIRLMFTVNGNTQSFAAKGNIARVLAALQIGTGCMGYVPFSGLIDELYVYKCLP